MCARFHQHIRFMTFISSAKHLLFILHPCPLPACAHVQGLRNPIALNASTLAALWQEGVDMSCLRRIDRTSFCEWKGSAIYFDVVVTPHASGPTTAPAHARYTVSRVTHCAKSRWRRFLQHSLQALADLDLALHTSSKHKRTNTAEAALIPTCALQCVDAECRC